MAGRHRSPARSMLAGVERFADFAAVEYRYQRPRGIIIATPPSADRISIRRDFQALRVSLMEGIRRVAGDGLFNEIIGGQTGSLLPEFLTQGETLELTVRWTDTDGRVWFSLVKPTDNPGDLGTPTFDAIATERHERQDSQQQTLWSAESIDATRRRGEPATDWLPDNRPVSPSEELL